MYDITIIGAGPAGISASLYAKRSNLNVLVLHNEDSNLEKAERIDNYYGFENGISGKKLYQNGIVQAQNLGVDIKKTEVVGIENMIEMFKIKTTNGFFESKSIILSTGNIKQKPNIKGIAEFEGKGVSYCAICDAYFFRQKDVVVIGSGNFAISEANELKNIVNNVTILTNGEKINNCNFKINCKKIKEILGENKVNKIEFEDGTFLNTNGVFIAMGEAGALDFAKKLGIVQNGENIKINERMETNIKGIFACGNITGGLLQISKAVYEGALAGLSAANYVRNI